MIYHPQWHDVNYLVDLLTPLVQGRFANRRAPQASMAVGGGWCFVGGFCLLSCFTGNE